MYVTTQGTALILPALDLSSPPVLSMEWMCKVCYACTVGRVCALMVRNIVI